MDQSAGVRRHAGTDGYTMARGNGIYAGELNTSIIIPSLVAIGDDGGLSAARVYNEHFVVENGITHGDWYLPSRLELAIMYTQRTTINATAANNGGTALASAHYWSSTEQPVAGSFPHRAWHRNFGDGLEFQGQLT